MENRRKLNHSDKDQLDLWLWQKTASMHYHWNLFVSEFNSLPKLTSFSLARNEKLLTLAIDIPLYLAVHFLFLLISVFKTERLKKVGKLMELTVNETA